MNKRRKHPHNFFDDAKPFKMDGIYCKLIPLTKGLYAIVWEEDYPAVSKWHWYACWSSGMQGYYAYRTVRIEGKRINLSLHRFLLGLNQEDIIQGDHVNPRMTLDNRRSNVRKATHAEQQHNHLKQRNNTSGFKGVSFSKKRRKYRAQIQDSGKRLTLGYCDKPEDAYRLYCEAAQRLYGEFAQLN